MAAPAGRSRATRSGPSTQAPHRALGRLADGHRRLAVPRRCRASSQVFSSCGAARRHRAAAGSSRCCCCRSASLACLWALQRLATHRHEWFSIITSQLAGNAFARVVPGGGAAGAALQYRMLVNAGRAVARGRPSGSPPRRCSCTPCCSRCRCSRCPRSLRGDARRGWPRRPGSGFGIFARALRGRASRCWPTTGRCAAWATRSSARPQPACGRAGRRLEGLGGRAAGRARPHPDRARPPVVGGAAGDRRALGLRLRDAAAPRWPRSAPTPADARAAGLLRRRAAHARPDHARRARASWRPASRRRWRWPACGPGRRSLATLRLPPRVVLAAAAGRAWRARSCTAAATAARAPPRERVTLWPCRSRRRLPRAA